METVIRRIQIGVKTVEVIAQHHIDSTVSATHHSATTFRIRIDGQERPDLTTAGVTPDELLNVGIAAAQIGF